MVLSVVHGYSQCKDWKWPEDKAKAEEKNVLYTDALRSDNFEGAKKAHLWILNNAPDLNKAIYINGEKIYKGLVKGTEDAAKKKVYVDSLFTIYDMRIEYCGEKEAVTARKAYSAYIYNIRNKKELPNVLKLFDEAFELNG